MFELRRPRPINGDTGPVIGPRTITVAARADHWFDCETHARLRRAYRLVLRIMRDVGRAVEEGVDAVTAVRRDDGAIVRLSVLFDGVADAAEGEAGFHGFDGEAGTFARGFDEVDVRGCECCRADVVGFVEVAVVAAVVEGDVEVDDVTVEEDARVGDTVTYYFVDGGAEGFGEMLVI